MHGYIKLHRKMLDWEWHSDPNTFSVFMHLLLMARFDNGQWKGVHLKPGQLITGRKALGQLTGISEQGIRTCLERLKATNEITIRSTNRFSVITIVNWAKHQNIDDTPTSNQPTANQPKSCVLQATANRLPKMQPTTNQQINQQSKSRIACNAPVSNANHENNNQQSSDVLTNNQPAINQQLTNSQPQRKNDKNGKEGRFTPPTTQQVSEYCQEKGYRIDVHRFVDFYTSKGWMVGKNKMKDWRAAVRNWSRSQDKETSQPEPVLNFVD